MNRPNRAKLPELYMKVLDPKKIVKLMVIQEVTQRQLARAAWGEDASHSYLGRILRGEIKSIKPDPAARIAEHLGVGMDDLFVPRLASNTPHNAKRKTAA